MDVLIIAVVVVGLIALLAFRTWSHRKGLQQADEKIAKGEPPIQRLPGPKWLKIAVLVALGAGAIWFRIAEP